MSAITGANRVQQACGVAGRAARTTGVPRKRKSRLAWLWPLAFVLATGNAVAQILPVGFLPPTLQDIGNEPQDIVVADFNGDGIADLAIHNNFQASGEPCVLVRLGNGDGTFSPAPVAPGQPACGRLIVADFDNDGVADLAGVILSGVIVAPGSGDGSFPSAVLYPSPVPMLNLWQGAAADVDGDGWTDIVLSAIDEGGAGARVVQILRNDGDGTFSWLPYSYSAPKVLGDIGGPVRLADIDGDGDVDLLARFGVDVLRFLGNGDATFAAPSTIFSPSNGDLQVADFNGDGSLDLAIGGGSSIGAQSIRVLLGAGDGTFGAPVEYDGGGLYTIVVADYNLDGVADLAFNSSTYAGGASGGAVGVLLGAGDGTFQAPPLVFPVITTPPVKYMATGDFDGNGRPDLALTLEEGPAVDHAVLLNVQSQFVGFPLATNGAARLTASILGDPGCAFSAAQVIPLTGHPDSPPPGSAPSGLAFPLGLLDFSVTGCTPGASLTIQVDYPSDLPSGVQYWKYGPTSGNPTPHWYVIPHVQLGPRTLQFTIVDGGLGDDDLAVNGTIVDAGGPAVPPPKPVPVNGPAGLALLMLLTLAAGARMLGTDALCRQRHTRRPTARR